MCTFVSAHTYFMMDTSIFTYRAHCYKPFLLIYVNGHFRFDIFRRAFKAETPHDLPVGTYANSFIMHGNLSHAYVNSFIRELN